MTRFILGGIRKHKVTFTTGPTMVNGSPALILRIDGEIDGVMAVRLRDTRITGLYFVRNSEKLTRVESETPLSLR
ncbi:hypothetical protein [Nocardia sp. NPDC052316]|uniref:hypothetical protein n=1 Tax=Nocardia sp. NPDC052316 TaxID=3364329 RepID=UPI0037C6D4EC